MIKIIADSTCDLNPHLLEEFNLTVLPLNITIQDKTYQDGIDITVDDIYKVMRSGILPKTAQISYEHMQNTFESFAKNEDDFIYISFSKAMSGCYSLAVMILKELKEKYPHVHMTVIDSKGGSSATGLIVLQALRMVSKGIDYDTLLEQIHYMVEHVEHIFSVGDIEWLAKGGRISKPLGYVGNMLNLRPWLDVENGKMIVKGMVRGRNKAIDTVAKELAKRAEKFPEQLIAISHADDPQSALDLEVKIKNLLPKCSTTICHIGGILGVHIGINGIGVYCFNEKPSHYVL